MQVGCGVGTGHKAAPKTGAPGPGPAYPGESFRRDAANGVNRQGDSGADLGQEIQSPPGQARLAAGVKNMSGQKIGGPQCLGLQGLRNGMAGGTQGGEGSAFLLGHGAQKGQGKVKGRGPQGPGGGGEGVEDAGDLMLPAEGENLGSQRPIGGFTQILFPQDHPGRTCRGDAGNL